MSKKFLLTKPLSFSALLVVLLLNGMPNVTEAATPRANERKPVSTAHAKKLQKRSIERKERNLRNLTKRIDGMVALVKDMQQRNVTDMMADNQTKARLHDLAGRQGKMKRELNKLKEQSVAQYAASRGIPLIPDPPTGAPPPLPSGAPPNPGLLTVPTQTPLPGTSFLPPGGAPKVTIDAQI